jgi:hypothetical protein
MICAKPDVFHAEITGYNTVKTINSLTHIVQIYQSSRIDNNLYFIVPRYYCLLVLLMLFWGCVFTAAEPMVLLLMAILLKILLSACHTHGLFVIAAFVLFLYGLSR